jgi:hypothetical protein
MDTYVFTTSSAGSFALQGGGIFYKFFNENVYGRDEMYYFEGLETDSSAGHLDDPRGEAPMFVSSPMIIKMKPLIPHQRANTRDPEIRNPRP